MRLLLFTQGGGRETIILYAGWFLTASGFGGLAGLAIGLLLTRRAKLKLK